jgi:hypothetical protein
VTALDARPAAAGPGDPELHRQRLLLLTCGLRLAYVVSTLADLGLADAVLAGPRPVAELAAEAGVDPDALYRVLRCAASVGVFEEVADGVFGRTPLSDPLAGRNPYSLLPLVAYGTKPFVTGPYAALAETVRTGAPATDFWGHLAANPDDDAFFDGMMTRLGQWETEAHLDRIRPERYGTLVDLGGGQGHFLGAALRRSPGATGVLVERPDVLERAGAVLDAAGVADRVERRAVDLFTGDLPAGADAYVLKAVLHNWPDDRALALLRRVRAVIGTGTLHVVEQVVAPGNGFDHGKFLDVDMLVLFGGRERTLPQWRELFAAAGFRLAGEPAEGRWTVLTGEPA